MLTQANPIKVRPILASSVLLLSLALALSACNKQPPPENSNAPAAAPNAATTPATTPPATTPSPDTNAATTSAPAATPTPVPATSTTPDATDNTPSLATRDTAAAPAPAPAVVIPAGATLRVRLDSPISTKTAQVGQTFNATLSTPVTRNERVVIPTGTPVTGEITQAAQAGRFKGGALLSVKLTSMTLRGKNYPLGTSAISQSSKARGKRTAIGTGGGAALGGIIGGLAGGGKGAVIGLASGAGAGAAGSAFTGNRDIELPAETPLSFHTTRSITLR